MFIWFTSPIHSTWSSRLFSPIRSRWSVWLSTSLSTARLIVRFSPTEKCLWLLINRWLRQRPDFELVYCCILFSPGVLIWEIKPNRSNDCRLMWTSGLSRQLMIAMEGEGTTLMTTLGDIHRGKIKRQVFTPSPVSCLILVIIVEIEFPHTLTDEMRESMYFVEMNTHTPSVR